MLMKRSKSSISVVARIILSSYVLVWRRRSTPMGASIWPTRSGHIGRTPYAL
jgi:hypothetical protein